MKLKDYLSNLVFVALPIISAIVNLQSCDSKTNNDYYSADDFYKIKKIDAHTHTYSTSTAKTEQAIKDNFILLSLNIELPDEPPIDSQQTLSLKLHHTFPKNYFYLTTFETKAINESGWSSRQLAYIKKSFDSGAIGIKIWKNIGMVIKDTAGHFIMIDNPIFDYIFNYLEQNEIPVLGHLGEPKNCWLPLDQMTTNNDRNYFTAHPEYHMYLHPEYPSYEAQIQARDNLLAKHPKLKFIGAHLGSMEWDVSEVAKRLDKYPNFSVEPTERFGQLQYQSIQNWQKVHDFFIKYQDRIMYGTDLGFGEPADADSAKNQAHALWLRDWKYLTTGDSLTSPFVNKKFKGMQLPKNVIDKIYYKNAEKCFFKKSPVQ